MAAEKLTAAELIRKRINPHDCLSKIHTVEDVLAEEWATLTRVQVEALRLQADIQFKKLMKVLPDMKATELSVSSSDNTKVRFVIKKSA